jgi:CHAT domain-containing protein
LGDYNILHLATHAALVPGNPEKSFILFNGKTIATLKDIENWTLNNFDLVVLSACETGLGGNFGSNGEEILGLGYQFQNRGAKATIASLWQVDDGGTQALMLAFYTELQQGKSKNQSLQSAQRSLLKDPKLQRFSHPYYWAPFILIGNGL